MDTKPCSVSKPALDILRNNINDEVVLISDDIQMQGIQKLFGTVDATLMGLDAGLDMIIIGNNMLPDEQNVFVAAEKILDKIKEQPSFVEKLRKEESRILNYKQLIKVASTKSEQFCTEVLLVSLL
jgi:beta-N-acetylhexosaminidase